MGAVISACGLYRMRLDRGLGGDGPVVALYGVNPSTADAENNDATIRKDLGFGEILGWSRIIKANKFAYRATDVRDLASVADPVGPENNEYLAQVMREADQHVFCWGPLSKLPKRLRGRWRTLWYMAQDLGIEPLCFGTAKDGQPLHTLFLPYTTELRPWRPAL